MKQKRESDSFLKQAFVTQTKGFIDVSKKRQFWADFAEQTNGLFKVKQTVSRDLKLFNLKIPMKNGFTEFMESDTHPLKVICEIDSSKQIEFLIAHKDFIDNFFKALGFRKSTFANSGFDEKYTVKSRDKNIVRFILKSESVIPLIMKTNIYSISCKYDKKKSKIKLMGMMGRSVQSTNEMHDVYSLFQAIVNQIRNQ